MQKGHYISRKGAFYIQICKKWGHVLSVPLIPMLMYITSDFVLCIVKLIVPLKGAFSKTTTYQKFLQI